MSSSTFVNLHIKWSDAEKKIARKAYNAALNKQCTSIRNRMKQMLAKASSPEDLWHIHDYLSLQRKQVSQVYDCRYSRLLDVFPQLLHDGWIEESDLVGLSDDKLKRIKTTLK